MIRLAYAVAETMPTEPLDHSATLDALRQRGMDVKEACWRDETVEWESFDSVLVGPIWDYHESHSEYLFWLDRLEKVGAVLNPLNLLRWNSVKTYLHDLAVAGVNVLPSVTVKQSSVFRLNRLQEALGSEQLIAKPLVGASACGIHRLGPGDDELLAELKETGDHLVQPYVEAIETEGEISVVVLGRDLSHSVRKTPGAGDFRVQEEHGGSTQEFEADEAMLELAAMAMIVLPRAPAYARVDMVNWQGRPALMELELIEPDLYLRYKPGSESAFADAVAAQLRLP